MANKHGNALMIRSLPLTHCDASRRGFLKQVGAGAIAIGAAGVAVPASGAEPCIRVGVIGCGVRGKHLMTRLRKMPGLRVTAVCDVYTRNLTAAQAEAGGPGVFATPDYQQVLERKDVDAVVVATPDRHHVPMTLAAVAAGKDVYVEKPLTYSLDENARILAGVKASGRIVQVGTQQRSMPQYRRAKELVDVGAIGKVRLVRMYWNRNGAPLKSRTENIDPAEVDWKRFLGGAPEQPFNAYKMLHWRRFWDTGGGVFLDFMVHWLDAAVWILGLDQPDTVVSLGDNYATAGIEEIPDTAQCLLQYRRQCLQADFCSCFVNAYEETGTELRGEKGTIYLDRTRLELHPEKKHRGKPEMMILDPATPRGSGSEGRLDGVSLHLANWLDCIRTRCEPNAPVSQAIIAATTGHWANIALREQRAVKPLVQT